MGEGELRCNVYNLRNCSQEEKSHLVSHFLGLTVSKKLVYVLGLL